MNINDYLVQYNDTHDLRPWTASEPDKYRKKMAGRSLQKVAAGVVARALKIHERVGAQGDPRFDKIYTEKWNAQWELFSSSLRPTKNETEEQKKARLNQRNKSWVTLNALDALSYSGVRLGDMQIDVRRVLKGEK